MVDYANGYYVDYNLIVFFRFFLFCFPSFPFSFKSRPSKVDSGMASANWCIFGWLLGLAQLLLHGALGLVLFWVLYFRGGFGWQESPKLEFNYHPVLMITGFVYLGGNGTLI